MNGPHDLGGMHGYGAIPIDDDEEDVFQKSWHARVFAVVQTMGATRLWNIDAGRFAMESLGPALYETSPYYTRWLTRAERLSIQHGLATEAELESGVVSTPARQVHGKLLARDVDKVIAAGASTERETEGLPRFEIGEKVRTVVMNPPTHTRLPRYARGKYGVVEKVYGAHVYPDSHAHGQGEDPQWLYAIRFEGTEIWGRNAEEGTEVIVDCWEPYLEKVHIDG